MRKPALVLYQGKAAEAQGPGRFAKDVLRVGDWVHPVTGQTVKIDRPRLQRLVDNTEKYRRNVDRERLPFPDGHSLAAEKNLGWWPGPFVVLEDRLYGVVEPTEKGIAEKLASGSVAAVSAMIEFDKRDSHGNHYDEVITHVCATPYPVIDGQRDFVKLSGEAGENDLFIPQELAGTSPEGNSNRMEGQMDLKKLAKALGLPEETPAEKILEAAEKAGQAATKLSAAETQQTAFAAELKAKGFEIKDGKVVQLSSAPTIDTTIKAGDSPELQELKKAFAVQGAQLSQQQSAVATLLENSRKAQVQNAQALATQLVKDGRIPPAMRDQLAEVLAINAEAQTLVLSTDGKAVQKGINLVDRLQSLFAAMPSIKGAALSSAGGPPAEDKASEDRKQHAREVAARVGGRKQEPAGTK